jgi:hypothetical protein
MAGIPAQHVAMRVRSGKLSAFLPLLQSGVRVACRTGVTLEELLVQQWGIEADYAARRITTLFVNSRAVDNLATTVVKGGAVVALSGAMPGLVGATMRAGGFYAAMRGAMTYRDDAAQAGSDNDWVRLKLFNLLLAELGPGFLSRGIIVTAAELAALLTSGEFSANDFSTLPSVNGTERPPAALAGELALLGSEDLLLTVEFEDKP